MEPVRDAWMTDLAGTDVERIQRMWRTTDDGDGIELFYSRLPIVDTFNASGVWTKRPGIVRVRVRAVHAGGGGGGGGHPGPTGGAGGGGGGSFEREYAGAEFAALPGTVPVVIPAGGAGGVGTVHGFAGTGGSASFNGESSGAGGTGGLSDTNLLLYVGRGGIAGEDGNAGGAGGRANHSQTANQAGAAVAALVAPDLAARTAAELNNWARSPGRQAQALSVGAAGAAANPTAPTVRTVRTAAAAAVRAGATPP